MTTLPLTNDTRVILLDDEDAEKNRGFRWHVTSYGYATRIRGRAEPNEGPRHIALHRVIVGAKPGEFVDHINRNTLDNRRSNLRIVPKVVNQRNQGPMRKSATGVRGVRPHLGRYFRADITANGKTYFLGLFKDLDSARAARLLAEELYWGEER